MALSKEEQEKIEAIKRKAAEQKRRDQAEESRLAASAMIGRKAKIPQKRRFTVKDFLAFRYMATQEIVTVLFFIYLAAALLAVVVGSEQPWYISIGVMAVSVLVVRVLLELAVVPFSINNHLADISEKLDRLSDKDRGGMQ